MIHNNDIEWEALIRGTLYYTGDGKYIKIGLQIKRNLVNSGETVQVSQYSRTNLI